MGGGVSVSRENHQERGEFVRRLTLESAASRKEVDIFADSQTPANATAAGRTDVVQIHKPSSQAKLGLTLQDFDDASVRVIKLQPGSHAALSGITVNDVVTRINGITVESAEFGCALLRSCNAGNVNVSFITTNKPAPPSSKVSDPVWASHSGSLGTRRVYGFDSI